MSDMKPRLVGGFGEINFGKQYRQGNRIYDADAIAVCLTAQPLPHHIIAGAIEAKCLHTARNSQIEK